jgi:hypothetical protein
MDHLQISLDWVLPESLRENPCLRIELDLARFAALVPLIPKDWVIGEFFIEMVRANPSVGAQLLPTFRDLPDDCWVKYRLLSHCGEEYDLRSAISRIDPVFDHGAANAAIEMLSKGVGQNLRENFEEALLAALGEVSLSREVEGVVLEFLPEAQMREASARWSSVEKAWDAELLSPTALVRLATYPHIRVWERQLALCRVSWRPESLKGHEQAIGSILSALGEEVWRSPRLCQSFLSLAVKLPNESVDEAIIDRLDWATKSRLQRLWLRLRSA